MRNSNSRYHPLFSSVLACCDGFGSWSNIHIMSSDTAAPMRSQPKTEKAALLDEDGDLSHKVRASSPKRLNVRIAIVGAAR